MQYSPQDMVVFTGARCVLHNIALCHWSDADLDEDALQDMMRCDADRHPLMPADADTQPAVAA